MALIVEDGTGREDANAFIYYRRPDPDANSWIIDAKAYWAARGRTNANIVDQPDTEKDAAVEAAIVRATFYLSESFQWKGIKTFGRNSTRAGVERFQALAWPRYGVYDRESAYVPSSGEGSIPREIQWATAEAAFYELENPHGLQPVHEQNKVVQQVRAGSASVTFATDQVSASNARPRLIVIADIVSEFLAAGASAGGSALVGTAVRG